MRPSVTCQLTNDWRRAHGDTYSIQSRLYISKTQPLNESVVSESGQSRHLSPWLEKNSLHCHPLMKQAISVAHAHITSFLPRIIEQLISFVKLTTEKQPFLLQ